MIHHIVDFAVRQRLLVLVGAALLTLGGVAALRTMPVDAFPDVTPVQVEIFAECPGQSAEDIERQVIAPVEATMNGLPGIREVRSVAMFGMSAVTVVFRDDVDLYFARQLVFERLQDARRTIPDGFGEPEMGPITTSMGQIYKYNLVDETGRTDVTELRTLQDWVVKYGLQTVPGVTEVLTFGGHVKEYQVSLEPRKLAAHGVSVGDVTDALARNNANVGGQFIESGSEELIVRGIGQIDGATAERDLRDIVVVERPEGPVFVRDVATVASGNQIRRGAVTMDGKGEVVQGIVLQLVGENTSAVIKRVEKRVAELNRTLPEGVRIVPVYQQAELVSRCIGTVRDALVIGMVLVLVVLSLFLGHARTALVVAAGLPVTVGITFILMRLAGLSGNLMSLGGLAVAIGLLVDGAVVVVDNVVRVLHEHRKSGAAPDHEGGVGLVRFAVHEVATPVWFAVMIIGVVFIPLFTLSGVEGGMFRPMALTIIFAMFGSLVTALLVVPALCAACLRGEGGESSRLASWIERLYAPRLAAVVARPRATVALALGGLALAGVVGPRLGSEFLPELDEGSILVRVTFPPSTSLTEATRTAEKLEGLLLRFAEVAHVVSQTGRSEVGGCPEPVSNSEVYLDLKPRSEWRYRSKQELVAALDAEMKKMPGVSLNFSQPIATRVDELVSGVRAQVAVKLFGDDLEVLRAKAQEVKAAIEGVRGAADVQSDQAGGTPALEIRIRRSELARYGLNVDDVQQIIGTAIGGSVATEVLENRRRFDVLVRYDERTRGSIESIRRIGVPTPSGGEVPLERVADIAVREGPFMVRREDAMRRVVVQCNVRGRDMGGFVEEAQRNVDSRVSLPVGYRLEWGGQFELQQSANARLRVVVPITVGLIFLLLFMSSGTMRQALLIISNVPLALVGGILAVAAAGLNLSVAASIGFIALFGVAVLNGVVMVSCLNQLVAHGVPVREAVVRGALLRLRPILMTAATTALGLLPLLLARGAGSEIQRPLAVVVVGGLITSTALTLFVLPSAYLWLEERAARPGSDV